MKLSAASLVLAAGANNAVETQAGVNVRQAHRLWFVSIFDGL